MRFRGAGAGIMETASLGGQMCNALLEILFSPNFKNLETPMAIQHREYLVVFRRYDMFQAQETKTGIYPFMRVQKRKNIYVLIGRLFIIFYSLSLGIISSLNLFRFSTIDLGTPGTRIHLGLTHSRCSYSFLLKNGGLKLLFWISLIYACTSNGSCGKYLLLSLFLSHTWPSLILEFPIDFFQV